MTLSDARAERLRVALKSMPMFRGLAPAELSRLEAIATLRDYERGAALWNAGDPAEWFTLIVRGRVKIVRHGAGGDVILEIFDVGEPVGAIAVYDGIPYPASAIAMEAVTLIRVPRAEYFDLLDRHPAFARAVMRELTRLMIAVTRTLGEARGQRVEGRVASLFLTLAHRMGRPAADGVEIPLALTRQEVAELVGTTVESAIRVLSRWGREAIVITGEHGFRIPSLERLRAVAGPAPDGEAREPGPGFPS
jgi:CRP/FNR family transcriptional regulator